MATVDIYREEGPEKSGLIHFTAFAPGRSEFWRLKVHCVDGEVMVNLSTVQATPLNPISDEQVGGLWLTLEDARDIAAMVLEILPGRERRTAALLRQSEARV